MENSDVEAVWKLLVQGADPNEECADALGSLLHHAISSEAAVSEEDEIPDSSVTALLIRYGADVNAIDSRGRTPLDFAVECHHYSAVAILTDATQLGD